MHLLNTLPDSLASLRQRADQRLASAKTDAPATAARALAVLHALAASPDTAADALALLHELQVHQVELELQHEELLAAKAELETALARQTLLYDHAPAAYLTLDVAGVVCELNLAAARLLGAPRAALVGQNLRRQLSPADADRLLLTIENFRRGEACPPCELALLPGPGESSGARRSVLARATADALPGQCLVVLMEIDAAANSTGR